VADLFDSTWPIFLILGGRSFCAYAVKKHTDCKWVLLYLQRWLVAPFQMKDGRQETRTKGTPQGGVVSPLLMNLFLHYVFDYWMSKQYPSNPFARYADDAVIHCKTQAEANELKAALERRFAECKLELHPQKTKIVYCKDSNRKGTHENISFDFLGYTFRGRLAKSKTGKYFGSFSPAISGRSVKHIHQVMREWKISRWTDAKLEMLADRVNPALRGWYNYFGCFYPSVFVRLFEHFNDILLKWVRRKYKRLRGQSKAKDWLYEVAKRNPSIFFHWTKGVIPAAGQ
jgi:RNA-directed DNA polymerase